MDGDVHSFLNDFILNEWRVNNAFRKETGLHRTHLEILSFAYSVISFNPCNVQQQFVEMNIQQVRLGIRKLVSIGAVEMWCAGTRNRPATYVINNKGRQLLNDYAQLWPLVKVMQDAWAL